MLRERNGFCSVDVRCVCCFSFFIFYVLFFFCVLVSGVFGCGENVGEGKESGFFFFTLNLEFFIAWSLATREPPID